MKSKRDSGMKSDEKSRSISVAEDSEKDGFFGKLKRKLTREETAEQKLKQEEKERYQKLINKKNQHKKLLTMENALQSKKFQQNMQAKTAEKQSQRISVVMESNSQD